MRIFYWLLSILSVAALWFADEIHLWVRAFLPIYTAPNANLLQVVLGILAGIFATKAADSSQELRRLLKVPEIETLISKADEAASRREEEEERYRKLVQAVKSEAQQQYARDMISVHREQLLLHWSEIQKFQVMLDNEVPLDPEVSKHILQFIVRTNYVSGFGRQFLREIPILGGILQYLFGPLWDVFYARNIGRINRAFRRK